MPRILVVAPNWIGDALMAQPLLARLQEKIAGLELDMLAPEWVAPVARFCDGGDAGRAAYFRLVLDDPGRPARRVETLARWRCAVLALPYGDQALLVSRRTYDSVGGFRPMPLMEDVDIARRLGRARLAALDHGAITSADRYRRDGWWARPRTGRDG